SVHAFAQSIVGPMYLGFLALVLAGGFGLIVWRMNRLHAEGEIDDPLSRETAFLGNNILFLALTFAVLLGTIYPLLAEALSGARVSVGGPFFRRTTIPVALMLIVLMGAGPLLPWRRASARLLRSRFTAPLWAAVAIVGVLVAAGMRNVAATVAFGAAGFALAGIVERFWTGTRGVMRTDGSGPLASLLTLTRRNRRLYGGLVVHAGVVIAAVAITTSSSFASVREATLRQGEGVDIAGYELRYAGAQQVQQPHRRVLVATFDVLRDGEKVGALRPSLNFYPASEQPVGSPALRVGAASDLYASLMAVDDEGRTATLRAFHNPGVVWLWVGGAVMAAGTLVAGWPARRRRRSTLDAPEPEPVLVGEQP
ncbi:MAG: cytochrome c-type biogenesis CcmF C-terminal domain-containing protein, partial [Actinomycetota bacterium]